MQALPWYPTWFRWEFVVHTLGDCSMLALYPPFLAAAPGTPLTRPFADPRVRAGLAVIAAALFSVTLLTPMKFGASVLYVLLIAYGILRTQLLDIDLRIRWTIRQSTLAGAVVAIVYLVSEGAERFLSSEFGNFAGLLAAALVVFFLAPLQRFAERVASVAMPHTKNTLEYAAFRKLQVYEAAVAEALQGGDISAKERALLDRLRDTLGIAPADAATLERDLQAGR